MQSQFLAVSEDNYINEASDGKHAEGFLAASYFYNTTVCSFIYYTEQMHADTGSFQSVYHKSQMKL